MIQMPHENLIFHKPTEAQWDKFHRINRKSKEQQEDECYYYDDCRICPMAIHQCLFSTERHICVIGMSEKEFEIAMSSADISF